MRVRTKDAGKKSTVGNLVGIVRAPSRHTQHKGSSSGMISGVGFAIRKDGFLGICFTSSRLSARHR